MLYISKLIERKYFLVGFIDNNIKILENKDLLTIIQII